MYSPHFHGHDSSPVVLGLKEVAVPSDKVQAQEEEEMTCFPWGRRLGMGMRRGASGG